MCLSRTRHLSAPEKAIESHWDPLLYLYRGPQNQENVKDRLRPAPERARASIVDLQAVSIPIGTPSAQ